MGSTSGTGRKWGVPQVQGGSEEYLKYTEEVGSISVSEVQGGSGEYLSYREGVGSTSVTGRGWGVPQVQGGSEEYLRYREEVGVWRK